MGYFTSFTLTIRDKENIEDEIIEQIFTKLEELTGDPYLWDGDNPYYKNDKWYDHDTDMLKLSECFPDIFFELEGNGEEHWDIWKAWYKGGKSYEEEILIDWPDIQEQDLK